MYQTVSESPEETFKLGESVAQKLSGNEIIALSGGLGTGKTVLARGIIMGLGIKGYVTSPTYTIIHEYSSVLPVYHLDLFRLEEPEELVEIGFEEYLYDQGIKIIEWPEVAGDFLPSEYLQITLEWLADSKRRLSFQARGDYYQGLLGELKKDVDSGN